jgi:putative acetyltransferase
MGAHRLATLDDASRLYHIRRQSILALAPPSMAAVEAEVWAAKLTLAGMERKLRELEIWVAELDEIVAGWGAIRENLLEGLYTAPEFAGQGIGAGLLDRLEGLMRTRGFRSVHLEASSNAPGVPPSPRLPGDRSTDAARRLAHGERTSRLKTSAAGE